MIYGDPIILGGRGGLADGSALLSVTVPAGSTATATKNGVAVTPSLWLSGADTSTEMAVFVFTPAQFDSGTPWTITATVGTATTTATVYITANKEYEVSFLDSLTLYNRGDQCTAITGGWTHSGYYGTNNMTVQSNALYFFGTNNNFGISGTANAINLSGYKTLQIIGNTSQVINRTGFQNSGILADKASSQPLATWGTDATGNFTKYVDISAYNGNYYVAIAVGISASCKGYIYEVRLLRDEVT